MEKLLRVLMLLTSIRSYTRMEIAEHFDITERTVYRYLNAIEKAGFVLEGKASTEGYRYRLITDNTLGRSLERLLHFSEEEAWLLHNTLSELKASSTLKDRLVKKLNIFYDFKALTQLEKNNELQRVHTLGDAIKDKKQVTLLQYRSSNTGDISDRKVEPFGFMEDYKAVWCYDTVSKSNKQFKVSRMQNVECLPYNWYYETDHHIPFTDPFHMSAEASIATVKAVLSLKAYNLLREEYPLAEKYIKKEKKQYNLTIPIADYHGIGRFVLGLPGEIKVLVPEEFKDFLKERRKIFFY